MNGRKVYNVRFYSPSIIHNWKKLRGRGKEDRSERKRREGEEEARAEGGRREEEEEEEEGAACVQTVVMSAALQCPFAKCGRKTQCGGHVVLAESFAGRSIPQSPSCTLNTH